MKLRPLKGRVLVEMFPQQSVSDGGIHIPGKSQEKSKLGVVRRVGIWRQFNDGSLRPFPVKRGEVVAINARRGRWLHGESKRLKIVDQDDILAVLCS